MSLNERQYQVLNAIERASSIISLAASSFVVASFIRSSRFRTPINRLIFYATLGNVLINAATLIASSGISRGVGSPLCQFQAFALQWLLPADGLWSFCMACNIYLALFRGYDVALLKKMEWKYFVFCYLVPFIPALTFLFVKTEARGKVYGSANNWCWISAKWRVLRIACVYGPIWIFIALTFSIYTIAGSRILECRRQLKRVSIPDPWPATSVGPNNQSDAIHLASRNTDLQPARQPPLRSTNSGSFEIHVSSSATRFQDRPLSRLLVNHAQPSSTRHDTRVEKNATVWAYAKRGMLFFVALIVTWTPTTVNRIYTVARPNSTNFALLCIANLAYPLQGFWNCVIYVTTSFSAVKELFSVQRVDTRVDIENP